MSESNNLTKHIITYIRMNRGYAERINVISRQIKGRYVKSTTSPGTPDIIACIKGRFVSIEVKIGKDRQSAEQKEQQQRIEKANGVYFIARDIDSTIKFIDSLLQ